MNLVGLLGKSVERTVYPAAGGDGRLRVGKVCGGFMRGKTSIAYVAVRPSGSIEKWALDGSVRLSSMAIAEREGVTPGFRIATHDQLEQHARDVVAHCRHRYEGDAMHYAVVCWEEGGDDAPSRWGMAASYELGPDKWKTAAAVMGALFEKLFGKDE